MTWFMICTTGKYYNNQIKNDDKSGTGGTHVTEETAHILQRPCGKSRSRREDNIKMVLKQTAWEGIKQIKMAQNKKQFCSLVNAAMDFCVILNAENFH